MTSSSDQPTSPPADADLQQVYDQAWALNFVEDFERTTGANLETGYLPPELQHARELLEEEHFQQKLQQANRTEDLTRSQMTVLGKCLEGTRDNTERWQLVRRGFGITAGADMPLGIWEQEFRDLAMEIDQIYLGNRDCTRINHSSIIQSYRQRVDAGQYNGAVGVLGQLQQELLEFSVRQNEVDFLASVEFCRSSVVRRMQREMWDQALLLTRGGKPPEAVIAYQKERQLEIDALMQGRTVDELKLDDMTDFSELETRMTEPSLQAIPTGIRGIDMAIGGGVTPGRSHRVHVIGADTGVGKSQLMTCCAMGLVLNKCDVLFISVELTADEMKTRLLSNFSWHINKRIPSWEMEKGRRSRQLPAHWPELLSEWQRMGREKERGTCLLKYELNLGTAEIEACIQQAKDRNPNLGAVFVDHFQDIKPMDNRRKIHEDVALRARELARIAKAHRIDMFVAAQLNREAASSDEPGLQHIADGYALARVAHAMWTIGWYKHPDDSKDLSRRWLFNAKKRSAARDENGVVVATEKHELFGDLDYSFLEQVG